MQSDIIIRSVFFVLFIGTLFIGLYLYRNFDRLLGPDPEIPGDNAGARGLNKVQVFCIWLHAVALTGGFAFFIH
ncbi:MAG TPA: hypothetical protein VG347_03100 [Verrucomicrobiae bacterium]|nr:hypothetical protein [Verrucomicrobiae bacterium]